MYFQFIHISVGEYVPMEIYANEEHHWNVIDDHLKNGIAVKIWWHKMVLIFIFLYFVLISLQLLLKMEWR